MGVDQVKGSVGNEKCGLGKVPVGPLAQGLLGARIGRQRFGS